MRKSIEYEEGEYEAIGPLFEAQFSSRCTVEYEHRIRRGETVTRVRRSDNPLIPISGVACGNCTKGLRKARDY